MWRVCVLIEWMLRVSLGSWRGAAGEDTRRPAMRALREDAPAMVECVE